MQTPTCLIALFIVLFCSLPIVTAHGTLHVDNIVPSATNSVLIQQLETDHMVVTDATVQFVKLNPTPGASFVADTLGPIGFDTSFLNFNSNSFVTFESGNDFNVQAPESIASTSDQLGFDSDRLFMTTQNDFVVNTHGNVQGTSLRQHINSLSTFDLHTGVGSLDLVGGVSTSFGGENVRFDGDNRVSFYSYNTLSIDALNNFQAYGGFIDFDSYGDINIESVTGNVEINSVRELAFLSDVINVSAPIGVELASEHANAYLNAADNLYVQADDLVYLDLVDEGFFSNTGNVDGVSQGDINVVAGNNINAISRFIQYTGSTVTLDTGNTILDTGGDILLRMNALGGLVVDYKYEATENIAFTSANIYGNGTIISVESDLGDVNFAALEGVSSLAQFTAGETFSATAGDLMSIGGSAVSFVSNTFHYQAKDATVLATSGVYDNIVFNSAGRIDAKATNIYGDLEVGAFLANGDIINSVPAGNFIGTADTEIDEAVYLNAGRDFNINAAGTVSFSALKGNGEVDTNQFIVSSTSYTLVSQAELEFIATVLTATAKQSLTMNLQQAFVESQRLDVKSTTTDITLEGEIIQFWANGDGSFTALTETTIDTSGDLNFSAFADITVSDLVRLTSNAALSFEANQYLEVTASNGNIQWDNTGTYSMYSNHASDIVHSTNQVTITADTRVFLDSGFVALVGADVLTKADDFKVDTTLEENVNFNYDNIDVDVTTAPHFATSDGNLIFDVTGVNTLESAGALSVTATTGIDINLLHNVVYQAHTDVAITAANDILIATTGTWLSNAGVDTTFTFTRYYDAHIQGDLSFTVGGALTINAGEDLSFVQNPSVAEDPLTTIVADNFKITMSGDYSQDGGSTKLTTSTYSITSAARIQHGSFTESDYTLDTGSGVNYDATNANSNVHFLSSDLAVTTGGAITFTGGDVTISSEDSNYLQFVGQTQVTLTSSAASPITWNAVYDWNVTAISGLYYTASGANAANVAISMLNDADTFSDVNFLVRDGETTLTSIDTQTFDADRIVLKAEADIYYKNPNAGGAPGGVRFDTQGSDHDGIYGDQAGISVRTTFDNSWIRFNITLGQALINSGYDLHQIVTDSQSRFYSDEEIRFLAQNGDVDIGSAGGSVVFQSTQRDVIWTTNKNTELQASAVIDTLAGKEINLVSSAAVSKFPQEDYHLGFEFSAEAGSISTQANAGFPIHFLGRNFDFTSAEQTYFRASDAIPITSTAGKFISIGETGLYYTVENGDLNLDASSNILTQSAKNFDIRVVSGLDSTWNAMGQNFTSLAGIDTILRSERLDTTFQTLDNTGDISISGGGQVRFQSDGTDDSVGGTNVDGIYLDAPNINSFSEDRTVSEAEVLYTVGLQTRPIINLVGGGDAEFRGVQFTAEGNIDQTIGQNFLINSQGSFLVNTNKDADYLATGATNIVSLGTNPVGKNVVFETDGEMDVSAANVQMNANRRITLYSDEVMQFKSTGTNPTNSYISIDVVDDLRSYVAKTMDFNAATWTWTADTSFEFLTLGNVEFTNGNVLGAGTTVSADSDLQFVSDINMEFGTTGANSDLTLSTSGTNSNIVIQTWYQSSDIVFNAVGNFVATSVNEMDWDSHGPASITAPYDELGSSSKSTINFNSADDYSLLAAGGLTIQSNDGMTLTAGGTASDFEVDSDGPISVFVWQNGVFSSVKDTMSFTTGYNITFANQPDQGGLVEFQSTRDIVQNYARDITLVSGDDMLFTAAHTFEFTLKSGSGSELSITTVNEDADINVSANLGPVILHTYENVNLIGGDTYFTAVTTATLNAGDAVSITTSGIHDKVTFDASAKLTLNGGDISFVTDVETTNGLSYQDFHATGKSSTGYAIQFDASLNTNVIAAAGGVSLWAATSITSTSDTLSFYADNFFPLAGYGLAVSASDGTLQVTSSNFAATSNSNDIVTLTKDTITILPFETSTFLATGSSQDYDDIGLLIQSNHESSDVRIFTTDFLTADLQFTGAAVNMYAEESITLLLLDDDDQAFVGTYLWIGETINIAAENEIYVKETSSGDIEFTGSGAHYFTAGDMLTITAREQLLFSAANWDVASTGSFTIDGAQVDYALTNQFVAYGSESMLVLADDINVVATGSVEITVGENNQQDGDPNGMLSMITQDATVFTSTGTVNINVDAGVAVDFRDGLRIPFRTSPGINPGVTTCNGVNFGGASSFFYETTAHLFCYCDINTLQCVQARTISFIP